MGTSLLDAVKSNLGQEIMRAIGPDRGPRSRSRNPSKAGAVTRFSPLIRDRDVIVILARSTEVVIDNGSL
jgi:hypothetical protein